MAEAKEEKKGEEAKKKDKSETDGVITAIYKVNLHCGQCASDIKKPLLKTQGVHGVEVGFEKGEIKVKGDIDVIKIHKMIEKLSKKKVELVSPKINIADKEKAAKPQEKVKEIKKPILRTTILKVHLHCDKCEEELRKKLLKHKGIFSVKTDKKAQTLTIQGTIEPDKLLSYIRKKVHKHAEIISSKTEEKEEKKEPGKVEAKKDDSKAGAKKDDSKTGAKKDDSKAGAKKDDSKAEAKKDDSKAGAKKDDSKAGAKKDDSKAGAKPSEKTEVVEFMQEGHIVKSKDSNAPYFVHYVYSPQLFSDENPNACSII
ncbi:hypothetical protein REPUB_Repub03eG0187900 [Reevesia pubescens]